MIEQPLLIVVTGRPASGKTTLAKILSQEIKCPLLSRDEFKEGYINTVKLNHAELDNAVNWNIYETFFRAVDLLISNNISVIIEAAFQHKLWQPKLLPYLNRAKVRMIICTIELDLAKSRFIHRASNDTGREKFHGDPLTGDNIFSANSYEPPKLFAPTLEVDTTSGYKPCVKQIIEFIKQ
jgi:predicted kinase